MNEIITTAEEREPECEPCATRHPEDGCADVGCAHNCQAWIDEHRPDQPTEPARVLPSREEVESAIQSGVELGYNEQDVAESTGYGSFDGRPLDVLPWVRGADAVLALFASAPTVEQVKAEALREHRRRVVRFMPAGLVNRATVLADLDDYANRLAPAQPVPDMPEVGLPTAEVPNVGSCPRCGHAPHGTDFCYYSSELHGECGCGGEQ